ncbi:MAG TPA: alpha/beta fold hydrolase [Candidatus Limnocylindrales bacterium]|nr:alpha/beta fold hydrolase [Candidatus Limnocylindrales bacterium]
MNKKSQVWFALAGMLCLLIGGAFSLYASRRYKEKHYVVDSASCRMNLVVVERRDLSPTGEAGSVVLLHGISANQEIMQYLARSFAEQGLRVFVPDLPGHGRSPGPFTPELAESCSTSLVRGLSARGMLNPERTILAGHSMGGAIALRIAERLRPAGVIAISPAPMQAAYGVIHENLLFHDLPHVVPKTLVLVGQLEPGSFTENARDLVSNNNGPTPPFRIVPLNTHVSMLFSPTVAINSQAWASLALNLPEATRLPSRANLLGSLMGLVGILLLAGPCIRDLVGKARREDSATSLPRRWFRGVLEVVVISLFAVYVLHYWQPLRVLHLFQGSYLASFFLLVGLGLTLLHLREDWAQWRVPAKLFFGAAISGFLFHFLIAGWFELTATSAWLTLQRWERFPLFLFATFLFLYGLELLSGPVEISRMRYRYWLLLVVLSWLALAAGVLYLKSGEFLVVLLSPYFALQFILSGLGVQLVRRLTGSATAAAVFGAILLAGLCLVLFPVS